MVTSLCVVPSPSTFWTRQIRGTGLQPAYVFRLSLIDEPFTLTAKDRRRIRQRKELFDGEHRVWNELDTDERDRARSLP